MSDATTGGAAPNTGATITATGSTGDSGPVNTAVTNPPTSTPDWTTGFNDELKGYVQNKGFKDPASVVDSYRNFEKLIGVPKDQLLKLPQKEDAPEWNDVWDRLGKPKEAKDYQLEVPEGVDPSTSEWAKEIFHKNNVTKKQGEAIVKEWNARSKAAIEAQQQQTQSQHDQQEAALKREWGNAYEQNSKIADQALELFGPKANEVLKALGQTIGLQEGMKLLHSLGSKIGEDKFVGGDRNSNSFGGALTPQQAKYKLEMLKADPEFTRRYIAGEAGPREEMQKLHEAIYAGQM